MSLDRPIEGIVPASLIADLHAALADDLVGAYLMGSAVSGGWEDGVSDLDLVAVTRSEAATLGRAALEEVHDRLVAREPAWAGRLEILYVSRAALTSFRDGGSLWVISPGEPFHVRHDLEAYLSNWYLLRETGLALLGPPPAEVVPPIAWAEFRTALGSIARDLADRPHDGATSGWWGYTILTLCRSLLTLTSGEPRSKLEAATWARARTPHWAWLIDAALRARASGGRIGFEDEATRVAAEHFIRLTADEVARLGTG